MLWGQDLICVTVLNENQFILQWTVCNASFVHEEMEIIVSPTPSFLVGMFFFVLGEGRDWNMPQYSEVPGAFLKKDVYKKDRSAPHTPPPPPRDAETLEVLTFWAEEPCAKYRHVGGGGRGGSPHLPGTSGHLLLAVTFLSALEAELILLIPMSFQHTYNFIAHVGFSHLDVNGIQ